MSTSINFEVVACHGDHAGKAHVSLGARDGPAEVAIRHMPFESDPGLTLSEEQAQILAQAAEVARRAAEFLAAEAAQTRSWPTSPHAEEEPPNVLGQPVRRGCS
jgi:hypothetical protein